MSRWDTLLKEDQWRRLVAELAAAGYYPELIRDSLDLALAGESTLSYLVSLETTFEREELLRHMTVAVLTPTRLVRCHVDEHLGDGARNLPSALTATEAVRLTALGPVVIERVVSDPAGHGSHSSRVEEIVVTVGWGGVARVDLAPAGCDDPKCEADHGLTGTMVSEDLSMRFVLAADGEQKLAQAEAFAAALSAATIR